MSPISILSDVVLGNAEDRLLHYLKELDLGVQMIGSIYNPNMLLVCKPHGDIVGDQEVHTELEVLLGLPLQPMLLQMTN